MSVAEKIAEATPSARGGPSGSPWGLGFMTVIENTALADQKDPCVEPMLKV